MRLIGKDIAAFAVGTTNPPSTSYLGTLKEVEYRISGDEQENGALKDAFHFIDIVRQDWTATFTIQLTDAAYPALLQYAPGQASANTTLYLRGKGSSTGGAGLNIQVDAPGVIKEVTYGQSDGAQVATFTLRPRGLLVFSGVN